jgi:hypothetical protein
MTIGNGGGRLLGRLRSGRAMGDDDINLQPDQLGSERAELFVFSSGPTVLDGKVTSFDVPQVTEPLPHRFDVDRILRRRGTAQEADPVNLPGLLRLAASRRGENRSQAGHEGAAVHSST